MHQKSTRQHVFSVQVTLVDGVEQVNIVRLPKNPRELAMTLRLLGDAVYRVGDEYRREMEGENQ